MPNNAGTSTEQASKQAAAGSQNAEQSQAAPAVRPQKRDRRLEQFSLPEIYNYDFDNNPKPWNENGKQDMDKYFNYGFTEETWRYHSREMQVRAVLS